MIHDQDLPMFILAQAYNTTTYIQNKCPHKILEDRTPEEVFTSINPKVNHFHVFGCPIYFHIPIEKRTKLENSNKKG